MIEYIKTLIMGIVVGITAPLPVSSSGHFYVVNSFLELSQDKTTVSFYYSFFMLAFSVVIMISMKDLYIKTLKSIPKKQKNYKLRLGNILLSVAVSALLFIPIPKVGRSLIDYFDSFLSADSFLNPILIGMASVFSGLFLIISIWYSQKGKTGTKKTVPSRSSLRMYIYSLPAYIIPGASKISISSVNLILCDINPAVILREVYFYMAPQIFIINIIKIVKSALTGITFDAVALGVGMVAVCLAAFLIISLLRKANIKKLSGFFSVYSILFGIAVAADAIISMLTGA